jgi:hypothetical protein
MRAMTGAIILYDHLHPQGAFHKKSPINVRAHSVAFASL